MPRGMTFARNKENTEKEIRYFYISILIAEIILP